MTEKKLIVIYKGENGVLKRGKHYVVEDIIRVGWKREYKLEGIKGSFDTEDFKKKEFVAFSKNVFPQRGKKIRVKILFEEGSKEVDIIPNKVITRGVTLFEVETDYSLLCVKVNVD